MKKHLRKYSKSSVKPSGKMPAPVVDEEKKIVQEAKNVVTWASGLADRGLAKWMAIDMPDGSKNIALVFPENKWEIRDGRLAFK